MPRDFTRVYDTVRVPRTLALRVCCFAALFFGLIMFVGRHSEPVAVSAENNTLGMPDAIINVQPDVQVADALRLGINIGSHNRFGASQILKNLVINPGFESAEYGQIFHTSDNATGERIQQENWRITFNPNTSLPEGFWDGADWEITYGPAKGRSGVVSEFTHEDDKYTYYLDSDGTAPELFDMVQVTTKKDGLYYPGINTTFIEGVPTQFAALDTTEAHGGNQSIRLEPADFTWRASFEYYMDTLYQNDASAGQMIHFEGDWCLDYWAKAATPDDEMNVFMWRLNSNGDFLFNTPYVALTDSWQKYSFQFNIDPNDNRNANGGRGSNDFVPPIEPGREVATTTPAVTLGFRSSPTNDAIWIDDVSLHRCDDTNPTAFSDTYVDLLKELQPGTIRGWGSQLGSTLDNQLATPFERRTTWHNPRTSPTPSSWHYSLHEFLELAQEVGANPWYNIPPTFTDLEMARLAQYLSAPATSQFPFGQVRAALGQTEPWTDVFDTIHLEYGNEMWGSNDGSDPFLGATAKGGKRLGQLADARFTAFNVGLIGSGGVNNINRIIGGQAGFTFSTREIEQESDAHNTVALAPYFAYDIAYANNDEELYYPPYARVFQDLSSGNLFDEIQGHIDAEGNGTELAIYEINFHTTSASTVPIDDRNDFVTGLNGGLALPLYMLTYQKELGIRHQTAFQAAQYSFKTPWPDSSYVRLWGMLRDVEATGRKRPPWLGMELVNKAVMGDMLKTVQPDAPILIQDAMGGVTSQIVIDLVHSFAFQDGDKASLVVFNLNLTEPYEVMLDIDIPVGETATQHVLTSANINDDNESAENITIDTSILSNFSDTYTFTIPPNAIYGFEWEEAEPEQIDLYLPIVNR